MNITKSKTQVLRAIQQYANSLEPHGHPAMGDDEIRIQTAAEIHKIIREMEMPEDRRGDDNSPVLQYLKHGAGGTLVNNNGDVVCTFNMKDLSLSEAFAYADLFINAVKG